MWRCEDCSEKNEDAFKTCWQCESPREAQARGEVSSATRILAEALAQIPFHVELPDSDTVQEPDDAHTALVAFLAEHHLCSRCGARGAEVGYLTLGSQPGPAGPISSHQRLLAASCRDCGSTGFFNSTILEREGKGREILARIFGVSL